MTNRQVAVLCFCALYIAFEVHSDFSSLKSLSDCIIVEILGIFYFSMITLGIFKFLEREK